MITTTIIVCITLHYFSIGSIYPDFLAHDNKGPPLYLS